VEIGSLVEKLLLSVNFHQKVPGCSPSVKLGTFRLSHIFALVDLNRSVYVDCKNRSNDCKDILVGIFHENFPLAPLEWNFENVYVFVLFPLLR
jgi:hypothetical protein